MLERKFSQEILEISMKQNKECARTELKGQIKTVRPQDLQQAIELEQEGKVFHWRILADSFLNEDAKIIPNTPNYQVVCCTSMVAFRWSIFLLFIYLVYFLVFLCAN